MSSRWKSRRIFRKGGDTGDSGDIIIRKIINDIIDIDLIDSIVVSTNVSSDARRGDIPLLAFPIAISVTN